MPLTNCPECGRQVSTAAEACPGSDLAPPRFAEYRKRPVAGRRGAGL